MARFNHSLYKRIFQPKNEDKKEAAALKKKLLLDLGSCIGKYKALRGGESPAAMSLRYTEASLRDRHTIHEPPPYSTRASVVQKDFFETLFYMFDKIFKQIF